MLREDGFQIFHGLVIGHGFRLPEHGFRFMRIATGEVMIHGMRGDERCIGEAFADGDQACIESFEIA
jgi:hypothetical protein